MTAVSEQPDEDLPSDNPTEVAGSGTPEIRKNYNLGTPHGFVMPRVTLPQFNIDYGRLLPDLTKLRATIFAPWEEYLENFRKQWAPIFEQWAQGFADVAKLAIELFPPNWEGTTKPKWEVIESILLDDGIPLAWIPRPVILQSLFDARDTAVRRRILG